MQKDEESFAAILEKKANADILAEQRRLQSELTKAITRNEFVGYIDIPESPEDEPYTADTRQGVAVKYISKLA